MENFQRNRREMVRASFEALPLDIQTEIFSRLPLKALMKCICTSKKWASLIRTKAFTKLYLVRSTKRPRLMLMILQPQRISPYGNEVFFQSVYEEEEPLLSSGQQQVLLSPQEGYVCASPPVRGLICLQQKTKVQIFNPGTIKSMSLPDIPMPRKKTTITTMFGYDELTDVYKVLCIQEFETKRRSIVTKEQHILTMGVHERAWRRITCEHQHSPVHIAPGLCTRGVLYYRARSNSGKGLVMRFNVRSEEFSIIELPEDDYIKNTWEFMSYNIVTNWELMNYNIVRGWELENYNGAIALVDDLEFSHGVVNKSNGNKVFHIWVLNETSRTWSRTPIEIPQLRETVEDPEIYCFRGTTRTKKLVFLVKSYLPEIEVKRSVGVVYYDPETKDLRRFKVDGAEKVLSVRFYLDHVDIPLLI